MTPTLQQKPESVGGSLSLRDTLSVASLYAEWGHERLERIREDLRIRAQWDKPGESEAYWFLRAADHFESALACFAFAAMTRAKEERSRG
jgi:hypothetical protein